MTELRERARARRSAALLARLDPVDLVLVEGWKRDRHPKIEAWRGGAAPIALGDADDRGGGVATRRRPGSAVPVFDLDDIPGIAGFILGRVGLAGRAVRREAGPALPPGVDWVPVDAALARLRARVAPIADAETVPLDAAGGRILAAPLVALRANPPAANAAVDGYGFARASLGAPPHALPLGGGAGGGGGAARERAPGGAGGTHPDRGAAAAGG